MIKLHAIPRPIPGPSGQRASEPIKIRRSHFHFLFHSHDDSAFVLDTGAPKGGAMVPIKDMEQKVAPGSTVGGCLVGNSIKAEPAQTLTTTFRMSNVDLDRFHAAGGKKMLMERMEHSLDQGTHPLPLRWERSFRADDPEITR